MKTLTSKMLTNGGSQQCILIIESVTFSYYEIYINCLRALTGIGFPYGIDEDAAYMVTWLELNKLDGIKKLVSLMNILENKFDAKIDSNEIKIKKTINLKSKSLLMKGPSLVDYLYHETIKKQKTEIILENCIDPIFLVPLAKKYSNKLNFINFCWNEKNTLMAVNISEKNIKIGELNDSPKLIENQVLLQLSANSKNIFINNINLESKKVNIKINEIIEQKNLKESICPNLNDWKFVSKFAYKSFVPATEESREKGAGGGDAND